jgi:hypothetical protein
LGPVLGAIFGLGTLQKSPSNQHIKQVQFALYGVLFFVPNPALILTPFRTSS